jgi:hypothetical protein
MDEAVPVIEALARLFGAVAWPAAVVVIAYFVLRRRGAVDRIVERLTATGLSATGLSGPRRDGGPGRAPGEHVTRRPGDESDA